MVNTAAGGGGTHKSGQCLFAHLGFHGVAQFGGVLAVALTVNQHKRNPLVIFDDMGHTIEILLSFLLTPQSVLLISWDEADWNVVNSTFVKHHQRVRLLRVLA